MKKTKDIVYAVRCYVDGKRVLTPESSGRLPSTWPHI